MGGGKEKECGASALSVFLFALVAGTACSLTSKILLSMKSVGMTGETEEFSFPLFQTFGMFVGMLAAMPAHYAVLYWRIPFPSYKHYDDVQGHFVDEYGEFAEEPKKLSWNMYLLFFFPALFDLVATALAMFGLRHVDVSMYQMLRGGAIIFVAILKHYVLRDRLKLYKWVGVGWNVVSIILVGLTAVFAHAAIAEGQDAESAAAAQAAAEAQGGAIVKRPLLGVFYILMGAVVQSLQYAFEEKVMSEPKEEDKAAEGASSSAAICPDCVVCVWSALGLPDINVNLALPPTPTLLLIGMEGFWGTIVCLFVLYPLAYYLPGPDHGSIENPFNTYALIMNSQLIQIVFVLYFFSVLAYNILCALVTFMLSSVWHAILDNFRPITVWSTDLFLFYFVTATLGESWSPYSWIQLVGMFVLLYGTAVYNAPNAGSIKLVGGATRISVDSSTGTIITGGLASLCMDFSHEYDDEDAKASEAQHLTGQKVQSSPYLHNMSPFQSSPRSVNDPAKRAAAAASAGGGYSSLQQNEKRGIAMVQKKAQDV